MPITFACKCGKRLRAEDEHAGKRVKCPACGRALVTPNPTAEQPEQQEPSRWEADAGPAVAARAEAAGVVRRGRASVVLLHSLGGLDRDLKVTGTVTCRNCKRTAGLEGTVFGRAGVGGELATVVCTTCRARLWVGYATRTGADGAEVFLYAPSLARESDISDEEDLPAPVLSINPIRDAPARAESDKTAIDAVLTPFLAAVRKREMYQAVQALAQKLVALQLSPARSTKVCMALRELLDKEQKTYLMSVLAETLACLRDEDAVTPVRSALRRALEADDIADEGNVPLYELCLLGLLYGDRAGFQDAVNRGMPRSAEMTRARKLGKKLRLKEVIQLVKEGDNIDAYETSLGGPAWQTISSIYTRAPEEGEGKQAGGGFLKRLFGTRKPAAGSSTTHAPLPEEARAPETGGDLREQLGVELDDRVAGAPVDVLWVNMKDERGARYDYQRVVSELGKRKGGRGVMAVRGCIAETMATFDYVGLICLSRDHAETLKWLTAAARDLWNCSDRRVQMVEKQQPKAINLADCMYTVAEFQWVG